MQHLLKRLVELTHPAVLAGGMFLVSISAPAGQVYFDTPEVAANKLVLAVARADADALATILGGDYRTLLPVDEIGEQEVERFFEAWAQFHAVVPSAPDTRMLAVGEDGWKLPIPIVREAEGWRFDTLSGGRLMRIQRIGRNELNAMQAALAYRDAQLEYAMEDRNGDGVPEYARKFISTAGERDGLFWEATEGEGQSPLGPLFTDDLPEDAYHGYHYKILTAQGEHAPGGSVDYLVDGRLVGGFALVAWPAEYGRSGVMSFMLSRDGQLFEADLGADSGSVAKAMTRFDPDSRWNPVEKAFTSL
jgi:hypothetical protein